METSRPSETIDLSKALAYLIRLFIENVKTILIITFLTVSIGLAYYWFSPKTYESKMIIQSDILSESYSLRLAENLSTHIKDKDHDYLSTKLKLTPEEAAQLMDFKIISALTPMSQQMEEKNKIIVIISVRVSDNAILPKLQEGIIHYLSSNDYIKKRVEENRKLHEKMIAALDREHKMLDSLKSRISNGKFSGAKVGDVLIMDLAGLYKVSADLFERKFSTERALATVDSVQIIEDLTPYSKPVWPKLSVVLLTSLILAAIIITIIISLKSLRNQITAPGS